MVAMALIGSPSPALRGALSVVADRLHETFDRYPGFEPGASRRSCVQCALVVRDFMQSLGIEARVAPVAAVTMAIRDGKPRVLGHVGSEDGKPRNPTRWNGHIVTIADGYLIDPTLKQVSAVLPEMAAVPLVTGKTSMNLPVLSQLAFNTDGEAVVMQWLDTPRNTYWTRGLTPVANKARQDVAATLRRSLKAPTA